MKSFRSIALLIFLFELVCASCVSNPSNTVVEFEIDGLAVIGPDYRYQGKISYDSVNGKLISSTGCEVAYTFFRPWKRSKEALVIIGHGFMRSKKRMARLAEHLASWGLSVVNVEFCNSKLWTGNHDLNGADMVAVSRRLNAGKVIYTGFSAGGLAAMIAADMDNYALALFGLDMVDNQGLGKKIAPNLTVPFYGLFAAPSACNANNNGLDSYALAPQSKLIKVEDSSHCHFEFPVDGKCSLVCGKGENRFRRSVIQQTILGLTTAFLLWQTDIDPNGETWWFDRKQNHQTLVDAGYIKNLLNDEAGLK